MVKWIGSLLSERNETIILGGESISKIATRGIPEGAKLSPPIWNKKGSKEVNFQRKSKYSVQDSQMTLTH